MNYDLDIADRIRRLLGNDPRVAERHMFGGLCWIDCGHLLCGIVDQSLLLRIGEVASESALVMPHVRPMDFTGRTLRGYVYVDAPGLADDTDLVLWIAAARDFVSRLPPKPVRAANSSYDWHSRVA